MNERSAGKWEKRRKIGRSKFITSLAVGFGVGFALLLSLIEWLTQGAVDYRWVVVRLVFFATIGFMSGVFLWVSREAQYTAYKQASPENKKPKPGK